MDPTTELLTELLVGEVREPPAAVDRHRVTNAAEQGHERQAEHLRLQIPDRHVDRGDRGRTPRPGQHSHLVTPQPAITPRMQAARHRLPFRSENVFIVSNLIQSPFSLPGTPNRGV